jgi:uncharacterized membrane protein YfcA
LEISQIIFIACAILLASFVQGAVGFGIALVLIPLMLHAGLELYEAIVVSLVTSSLQNVLGIWRFRQSITPREVALPCGLRLLGLLPGFMLMPILNEMDTGPLKQIFGVTMIVVIGLQLSLRIQPREDVKPFWGYLAFTSSGFFQGTIGPGGPPLVFWLMAHNWSHDKNRAFLYSLFLVGSIPHTILVYIAYRNQIFAPVLIGLALSPITLIGTSLGLSLGTRMNSRWVKVVTYSMLLWLAVSLLTAPLTEHAASLIETHLAP